MLMPKSTSLQGPGSLSTPTLCVQGKAIPSFAIHWQLRAMQSWFKTPGDAQQLPTTCPEELIPNDLRDTQSKGPQQPFKG